MTKTAAGRRAVIAWCLYDWANSAFPAIVQTFVFATYFTSAVAPTPAVGTALWGQANSIAALAIAILGPVFGAIADQGGALVRAPESGRRDFRARRHGHRHHRLRARHDLLQRHAARPRSGGAGRARLRLGLGRRLCRRA